MENSISKIKKEIEAKKKRNEERLQNLKEKSILYNVEQEKRKKYLLNKSLTFLGKKRNLSISSEKNSPELQDSTFNENEDYEDYEEDFLSNSLSLNRSFSNLNFRRPERFTYRGGKKSFQHLEMNSSEFNILKKEKKILMVPSKTSNINFCGLNKKKEFSFPSKTENKFGLSNSADYFSFQNTNKIIPKDNNNSINLKEDKEEPKEQKSLFASNKSPNNIDKKEDFVKNNEQPILFGDLSNMKNDDNEKKLFGKSEKDIPKIEEKPKEIVKDNNNKDEQKNTNLFGNINTTKISDKEKEEPKAEIPKIETPKKEEPKKDPPKGETPKKENIDNINSLVERKQDDIFSDEDDDKDKNKSKPLFGDILATKNEKTLDNQNDKLEKKEEKNNNNENKSLFGNNNATLLLGIQQTKMESNNKNQEKKEVINLNNIITEEKNNNMNNSNPFKINDVGRGNEGMSLFNSGEENNKFNSNMSSSSLVNANNPFLNSSSITPSVPNVFKADNLGNNNPPMSNIQGGNLTNNIFTQKPIALFGQEQGGIGGMNISPQFKPRDFTPPNNTTQNGGLFFGNTQQQNNIFGNLSTPGLFNNSASPFNFGSNNNNKDLINNYTFSLGKKS